MRFNPGTGELLHYERIRVRVEFVEALAPAAGSGVQLRAVAAADFQAPLAATGWSIPAGAAYKVSTNGEGIYRITRAGLQAAGIADADIDAINLAQVQLFNLGVEQALHVVDANSNNRLDPGDSITLIRRGRTRGVSQVRQVQRVLADRCGQRQPPAHDDH